MSRLPAEVSLSSGSARRNAGAAALADDHLVCDIIREQVHCVVRLVDGWLKERPIGERSCYGSPS